MTKTSPLGGGGNKVTHTDHIAQFLFELAAATSGSGLVSCVISVRLEEAKWRRALLAEFCLDLP